MTKRILIAGSAIVLGGGAILSAGVPASASAVRTPAAQVRAAKFAIANMTCPTCPITVKKAMQGVAGVRSVSIDLDAKTATVVFDATMANVAAIAAASTDAGFPAKLAR
jgi:mercuric ion binding protein